MHDSGRINVPLVAPLFHLLQATTALLEGRIVRKHERWVLVFIIRADYRQIRIRVRWFAASNFFLLCSRNVVRFLSLQAAAVGGRINAVDSIGVVLEEATVVQAQHEVIVLAHVRFSIHFFWHRPLAGELQGDAHVLQLHAYVAGSVLDSKVLLNKVHNPLQIDSSFSGQNGSTMQPAQLWTVPFQEAALMLLRNKDSGHAELVWIPTDQQIPQDVHDLSLFALNHNSFAEDPGDFRAPPTLLGDGTMGQMPIIMAATEGRTDLLPKVRTAMAAVTIRKRDTLLFDQLKQEEKRGMRHWRQFLTDELKEVRGLPISAACFVLDALLLYASHDGMLRAHPRGNPHSTYHVQHIDSLVSHVVGLYNVVAVVHTHSTLEVRHVERDASDPFIRFPRILWKTNDAMMKTRITHPSSTDRTSCTHR